MTTTLTAAQAETMSVRIWDWLDTLTARSAALNHVTTTTFDTEPGRRYVKVIAVYGGSRSVHAFYEPSTGNVYKAAGWKAPAKGVRFNLLDDESYARMLATADPYGGYLYMR